MSRRILRSTGIAIMDALALLCTLHADGPTTLRRLRQVGCSTIQGVEALPIEQLAEILAGTPAAARRFCREARALHERCAVGWLEHEELATASAPAAQPFLAEASSSASVQSAPTPASTFASHESDLAIGEREILDRVLRAWRERDAHEPAAATTEAAFAIVAAEVATAAVTESCASASHDALFPGAVDGLSDEIVETLRAHGVRTLAELARCDALVTAQATDLGYTRVARLRALAERACAVRTGSSMSFDTRSSQRSMEEKVSLAEGPQPGRTEALCPNWSDEIRPHSPLAARSESRDVSDDSESAGGPFV